MTSQNAGAQTHDNHEAHFMMITFQLRALAWEIVPAVLIFIAAVMA